MWPSSLPHRLTTKSWCVGLPKQAACLTDSDEIAASIYIPRDRFWLCSWFHQGAQGECNKALNATDMHCKLTASPIKLAAAVLVSLLKFTLRGQPMDRNSSLNNRKNRKMTNQARKQPICEGVGYHKGCHSTVSLTFLVVPSSLLPL